MTTIAAPEWLTVARESLGVDDIQGCVEMCDDAAVYAAPLAREGRTDRLEGQPARRRNFHE